MKKAVFVLIVSVIAVAAKSGAYAQSVPSPPPPVGEPVCHKSADATLCVEKRLVGLNVESRFKLTIQPNNIVAYVKRLFPWEEPNTLTACRTLVSDWGAQSDPVFSKLSPAERTDMKGARLEDFEVDKDKKLFCHARSREIVGTTPAWVQNIPEGLLREAEDSLRRDYRSRGMEIVDLKLFAKSDSELAGFGRVTRNKNLVNIVTCAGFVNRRTGEFGVRCE